MANRHTCSPTVGMATFFCVPVRVSYGDQGQTGSSNRSWLISRTGPISSRAAANEYFNKYLSTHPSILATTRVLVNTGTTLIQAANDEDGVVGQRTLNPKGLGP